MMMMLMMLKITYIMMIMMMVLAIMQEDPENYLFLKYEDMIDNPTAAIIKIAEFISIPVNEELIELVVRGSSLNEMKV